MAIIISKNGKNAQKIDESEFGAEDNLQQYILDNPDAIPLYDIDEDIRLFIAAREFPTKSGPIDALGFDLDGNIYVIETKLYKNHDKRKVVAQALDYGASLWKRTPDFDSFLSELDAFCEKYIKKSFRDAYSEFFGLDDSTENFSAIKDNLSDGVIKFVVLMDSLHDGLKDLVVFINQNSKFDLYAVELEYYKHGSFEIVIPKLYGSEVKKDVATRRSGYNDRRKWNETDFWQDVDKHLDKASKKALRTLYDWFVANADGIRWGTGITKGSFNPYFSNISQRSFMSFYSDGTVQVSYGYLPGSNNNMARKKLRLSLQKHAPINSITAITDKELNAWPIIAAKDMVKYHQEIILAVEDFVSQF